MWKEIWYESWESCAHCVVNLRRMRGADAAQNTAYQPHKVIYFSFSVNITATVLLQSATRCYPIWLYVCANVRAHKIRKVKLNLYYIYIKLPCASTNIIYFIYCLEFLPALQTILLVLKTDMVWETKRERKRRRYGFATGFVLHWKRKTHEHYIIIIIPNMYT